MLSLENVIQKLLDFLLIADPVIIRNFLTLIILVETLFIFLPSMVGGRRLVDLLQLDDIG